MSARILLDALARLHAATTDVEPIILTPEQARAVLDALALRAPLPRRDASTLPTPTPERPSAAQALAAPPSPIVEVYVRARIEPLPLGVLAWSRAFYDDLDLSPGDAWQLIIDAALENAWDCARDEGFADDTPFPATRLAQP